MSSVKGFAPWRPRADYATLLEQVQETMQHLKPYWPLTQRAWLYRLIGRHQWTKAMEDPCLQRILDRGRRSGVIPWEAVASKRGVRINPWVHDDVEDMVREAINSVSHRVIDRQLGQRRRMLLWVEAEGLVPLLEDVGAYYGLPVYSGSGFDSIGGKYDFARFVQRCGEDVLILHVGDLDPSGVVVHKSLMEDVAAFVTSMGGHVELERVGVLDEHVDQFGMYWEPPIAVEADKSNHRVHFGGERCAQAEAMEPEEMVALVEAAILQHVDAGMLGAMIQIESDLQEEARSRLFGTAA